MKAAFVTLGCKVNQYDSQAVRELFLSAGYEIVDVDRRADVYVINTCTVTHESDRKSRRAIRRCARVNPGAAIVVAGCLSQRDAECVKLPGVKLIIGTQRRGEVVELLEKAMAATGVLVAVDVLKDAVFERTHVAAHEKHTRALMKIQEGCDRHCSYCIIPSVRGAVRSMPLEDISAGARRLAMAGYKEIVLTGIHIASYGRDINLSLVDALKAAAVPGVKRLRIGSLDPMAASAEFARAAVDIQQLAPHFHLPLQSGCDEILHKMRRQYNLSQYATAVDRLRVAFPGCAITTDIITGFPGETDAQALETENFACKITFSRIHVFPYSEREGTLAASMPNPVPKQVRKSRAESLATIGDKLSREYAQKQIGQVREVLFEEETHDGLCVGYTREYVEIIARGVPGEIRDVFIESANIGGILNE